MVNVGFMCGMWGRGIKEVGRMKRFIRNFWEMEIFHLECGREEWKNMYFVCDFNGK